MPKPILYGPLIRAGVFAFVALFALSGPSAVTEELARYPRAGLPQNFMTIVWASALAVFVVFGVLAWRVAMEAFPPKGTLFFPVRRNITTVDVLVAPFAGLLLLLDGLFPRMWLDPSGRFGLRDMDLQQLLILTPMGLALLLWRPMWSFTRGQPVTRYPAGPWLPWRQAFPLKVELEWIGYWAGKPRVQVGWQLLAKLGELELDLDVVGLETPQHTKDAIRAEWALKLDTGVIADQATQQAALNRKKVKPWHLLAAMFGLPGLGIMLFTLFRGDLQGGPQLGVIILLLLGTAALSLWFFSRFVSMKGLAVASCVLLAISITGVLTGLARGERHAIDERLPRVCDGLVALANDVPSEGVRWFTFTGSMFESARAAVPSSAPKFVACQQFSSNTIESLGAAKRLRAQVEVTVRRATTGERVLTKTVLGPEPAPFDDANPRDVEGDVPARGVIEAELLPAISAIP